MNKFDSLIRQKNKNPLASTGQGIVYAFHQ